MDKSESPEPRSLHDVYAEVKERAAIWETPQFTLADVSLVTRATPKAIEHFINPARDLVRLRGSHVNPGSGKRRLFTGVQVVMIKAAFVVSSLGFPQRWSPTLTQLIERRTDLMSMMNAETEEQVLITYPAEEGNDWIFTIWGSSNLERPQIPTGFIFLEMDRLILETKKQLEAIVSGVEPPSFRPPEPPKFENPYSPKVNFFKAWSKDELGRWVYVGLNHEETLILLKSQDSHLEGDELVIDFNPAEEFYDPELRRLRVELRKKHEQARAEVLAAFYRQPDTS
ncbi:hypothetical protein [Aquidulcibacter sp.]|uniref:hypothetical protein n=1 Tax=Aquidulcibacter sp. TaxID=2052990 RepID=UPI003BA44B0E